MRTIQSISNSNYMGLANVAGVSVEMPFHKHFGGVLYSRHLRACLNELKESCS